MEMEDWLHLQKVVRLSTVCPPKILRKFFDAVDKLQEPLERFLYQQEAPPSCIIFNKCLFGLRKPQKARTSRFLREKMCKSESEAFGVIVNSFQELETGYAEAYVEAIKKKVWFVGPVSYALVVWWTYSREETTVTLRLVRD
ncbi:hypothetical protein Bca4012_021206 [Brassica carinata]